MTNNNPLYQIAVRRDEKIGFVLIARNDDGYVGEPKWFHREEMLETYAELVTEFGGKNVSVGEVKLFFLVGHVEEVPDENNMPWMNAGKFLYEEQ